MISTEVRLHGRVLEFCRCLPPEPRRRIRNGIRALRKEQGDIKELQGKLAGLYRLKSGPYRVIFSIRMEKGVRIVFCHYAEHRSVVYEILEAKENLKGFLD